MFAPESLLFLQKAAASEKPPRSSAYDQPHARAHVNDGEASTFSKCRTQKKSPCKMPRCSAKIRRRAALRISSSITLAAKRRLCNGPKKVAPLIGFMPRVVPASPVIGVHVGPAMGIAYECNAPIPNKFHNSEPEIIVC